MLIIKYSQFSVRTASAEPVRVRWRCTKHAKRDGDLQASGRYADARSCSLVLVPFAYAHCTPARFTSPRCFSRLIGQMMTHPFTRRLVSGLLLSPASHTMLRIVFIFVGLTHANRPVFVRTTLERQVIFAPFCGTLAGK